MDCASWHDREMLVTTPTLRCAHTHARVSLMSGRELRLWTRDGWTAGVSRAEQKHRLPRSGPIL